MKENRLALNREQALRRRIRRHPAGHVEASWVTLRQLMVEAYGVRPYQIVDAPEWVLTDHFEVEARAPLGADPADTDAMLRLLLEDRFGLVVRNEMRRLTTYALEIADGARRLGPGSAARQPVASPSPRNATSRNPSPLSLCVMACPNANTRGVFGARVGSSCATVPSTRC